MSKNDKRSEVILRAALKTRPELYNTDELQRLFGLSLATIHMLIKHTKKYAAEQYGVSWGYDPAVRKFRVSPANSDTANRMKDYAYKHMAQEGDGLKWQLLGWYGQGHLTSGAREQATREVKSIQKRIISAGDRVVFSA